MGKYLDMARAALLERSGNQRFVEFQVLAAEAYLVSRYVLDAQDFHDAEMAYYALKGTVDKMGHMFEHSAAGRKGTN